MLGATTMNKACYLYTEVAGVSRLANLHIPEGASIPHSESSQWGDYHLRELAVLVERIATDKTYPTFFGPEGSFE